MEENKQLIKIPVVIQDAVAETTTLEKKQGGIHLSEGGRVYKTYLTKKFAERKSWKAPNPLQVLSHIPGSVVEICVKVGQKVKKDDKLMVYEAMKMKNIVKSPMNGEIKEINAKLGEHLPKGALLLTFKKPTGKK